MQAEILHSERLTLVPLDTSFCTPQYVQWMNDPDVIRYLESGGDYTIEKVREYLGEVEKKKILFWAIVLTGSDKHIGNIKIDPVNEKHGLGEYAIMMGDRSEWGKGYAAEASETVIRYCFEKLHLRKLTLGVIEDNVAAVNLYHKLGFVLEGTYRYHGIYAGKYCNALRMALFNPDFKY